MINRVNSTTETTETEIIETPIVFGSKGIKLIGTLYMPSGASKQNRVPAAILCHGYGNKQTAFETSARELAAEGVATLTFDFRGHGASGGLLDGSIVDDVMDAWNYLQDQPEVDRKRMGIIGHSMGAFSGILAAGKLKKAKVLIALACPGEISGPMAQGSNHFAFGSLRHLVAFIFKIMNVVHRLEVRVDWKKFIEFWPRMKPSEALADLENCSKLFVFCLADKASPYHNFMYSYAMASEPKQVMVASGRHTTPMEFGTLRTQWMKWAVQALHGRQGNR